MKVSKQVWNGVEGYISFHPKDLYPGAEWNFSPKTVLNLFLGKGRGFPRGGETFPLYLKNKFYAFFSEIPFLDFPRESNVVLDFRTCSSVRYGASVVSA
jgi:hypothetical protein